MILLVLLGAGGCDRRPIAATDQVETPATVRSDGPAPRLEALPAEFLAVLRLNGVGRIDDARELARRYVRDHPNDGRGHVMIGMTYHKAGNYEPAAAEFRRALELSPDYYPTRRYFGECLFMLGDLPGARREYTALLAADPDEPQGQYGLGLVDLEESRLADAETHFRRAIGLFDDMRGANPRHLQARGSELAQCHARLADVHFARDEYAAARDELLASTAIEPRNISAFYTLSLVCRRLGEDEQAERALQAYETAKAAILERMREMPDDER